MTLDNDNARSDAEPTKPGRTPSVGQALPPLPWSLRDAPRLGIQRMSGSRATAAIQEQHPDDEEEEQDDYSSSAEDSDSGSVKRPRGDDGQNGDRTSKRSRGELTTAHSSRDDEDEIMSEATVTSLPTGQEAHPHQQQGSASASARSSKSPAHIMSSTSDSAGTNSRDSSAPQLNSRNAPGGDLSGPVTWITSSRADRDKEIKVPCSPQFKKRIHPVSSIPTMRITIPRNSSPGRSAPPLVTLPVASSSAPQLSGTKTQAAFVNKLYAMLEDEAITKSGLIGWSADGTVFSCLNPTDFSKVVLPQFFKHNNWQSFVRQLNMYGFNKVNDLFQSSTADPQAWEFRHPNFRRGEPQLLASIKRKSTRGHVSSSRQQTPPFSSFRGAETSPSSDHFQHLPQKPESSNGRQHAKQEDDHRAPNALWTTDPVVTAWRPAPPSPKFEQSESAPPPKMPQLNSSLSNRPMSSTGSVAMDLRRSRGNAAHPAITTSAVSPRPPPPSHEMTPTHAPSLRRAPSSSGNTPHGTSSWSGSAASGSTPPEALSMHIAVLEAQLKSTMQKLHREKVDNRVSSLGMVSMMSRLISVVYTETRTPHTQAALRDVAETLSKQQLDLEHDYQHLVSTDQQQEWDAVAERVRMETLNAARTSEFVPSHLQPQHTARSQPPFPGSPASRTVRTSHGPYFGASQPPLGPRKPSTVSRSDLPSFAAQGLPPLLDREGIISPETESDKRLSSADASATSHRADRGGLRALLNH